LAEIAVGTPINGTIEIAGPEKFRMAELVRQLLNLKNDPRQVIPDVHARYFGAELNDKSLVPDEGAKIYPTTFDSWLGRQKMTA